jgi:hypothetical protein
MKTRRIATLVASGAALLSTACSSPRYIARGEMSPAPLHARVAPQPGAAAPGLGQTDEAATRAWFARQLAAAPTAPAAVQSVAPAGQLTGESAMPGPAAAQPAQPGLRPRASTAYATNPTNEDATRAFLQQEIEYQRTHNPERQPEPIYQTVERQVYVDRTVYQPVYGAGYDAWGQPVYVSHCNDGWSDVAQVGLGVGLGLLFGHWSHCHW